MPRVLPNSTEPRSSGQDLAARYEHIRGAVCGNVSSGDRGSGLVLLMRHGLAIWMRKAVVASEPPSATFGHERGPVAGVHRAGSLFPFELRDELVMVMASILLPCRGAVTA